MGNHAGGPQPDGWQYTKNDDYFTMVEARIRSVDMVWVSQFLDIISESGFASQNLSIKDIGCQAFQFYKLMKKRGLSCEYFGYELEKRYVDIGLRYFPELDGRYVIGDFSRIDDPIRTDVSVCSATIEHVDRWGPFLENMLGTTSKLALIRTFLGDSTERTEARLVGAAATYPIWQFSFRDFLTAVRRQGFLPEVLRDRYTDSLPKLLDVKPDGLVRTQYVVAARRIEAGRPSSASGS